MSRPCIILRGKVTIGDIGPRVFTAYIHCRINNMGAWYILLCGGTRENNKINCNKYRQYKFF